MNFLTQVNVVSTRCCNDGANHPSGRLRLRNLALRYLVCLALLPRLKDLLDSKDALIVEPKLC
jgi:hypothetical protein